jgi:hypothetical protein
MIPELMLVPSGGRRGLAPDARARALALAVLYAEAWNSGGTSTPGKYSVKMVS